MQGLEQSNLGRAKLSHLNFGDGIEAVGSADHGHRGCCVACVQGRVDLKQPDVVFWLVICESSNNSGIPETVRGWGSSW